VTWTCPAGGLAIISVTVSGASGFSAFTAGAVESVGAAAAAFSINKAATSNFFIYGITGNGGTNISASCDINLFSNATNANSFLYLSSCTLDVKAASTSAQLNIGQSGTSFGEQSTKVTALNCTFICSGSRAGTLSLLGSKLFLELINPTFSMTGGTKPAILFDMGLVGDEAVVVIRDGDISGYNVSSGAYFNVANFASTRVTIQNCKTSSTPALTTGTWSANGTGNLLVLNADSANTLYVFHYDNAYGTLDAETTDFVTTGGAHFNGSPIAWKVVTKSTASEFAPFILPPLVIWNTTTTAQTSAIEIAQVNGAAALTDRQIWSDLDYPASASFPNGSWQSNRSGQPFVGTGVAHATSTNPWTVPNIGASPVTQKLQSGTATTPATFTAAAVGPIQSKISIGVATLTLWINPNIDGIT
jgi:hypothetical protein